MSSVAQKPKAWKGASSLSDNYLKNLRRRCQDIQSSYISLILQQKKTTICDTDALVAQVCGPAFRALRVLANTADSLAEDPDIVDLANSLIITASAQTAVGSENSTLENLSTGCLVDQYSDKIFQDYKAILVKAIDTWVLWDSPSHSPVLAKEFTPDKCYKIIEGLLVTLSGLPVLTRYASGLLSRIYCSRSCACYVAQDGKPEAKTGEKRKAYLTSLLHFDNPSQNVSKTANASSEKRFRGG
ncbi:hypothetical protein F5Y19DRAFT_478793 [Xylariaceae sp. FL1651]|nr:hypothetical protein F5Y19DRAFT_478793 [Xylariaceae sp. FL1651]